MTKKKTKLNTLNESEVKLITQLRAHPEMMERLQSILEITGTTEGPLKSADEVEERLLQEMRRLGNASMHHWASQAEERVSHGLASKKRVPTKVGFCILLCWCCRSPKASSSSRRGLDEFWKGMLRL